MLKVLAIARLTFSAERHRPEILILLLLGFCLTLFMGIISLNPDLTRQIVESVNPGSSSSQNTLMLQGGLFYSEVCLFLIGFVIGMNALFGDEKSGILDILLSKPITRTQYLFGKFLGAIMLCSLSYSIMILPVFGVTGYSASWSALVPTFLSLFFGTLKIIIFMSVTFFFLMRVPRLLAPVLGLMFVISGYFSEKIYLVQSRTDGIFHWLSLISYYLVPHLTEVTVATLFDPSTVDISYTKWLVLYGVLYPGAFLILSLSLFRRKSF